MNAVSCEIKVHIINKLSCCELFMFGCFNRFGPYFVEPIIAGLHPKTFTPYVASMDLIGCPMETEDFAVSGTCSEQMFGICESLWQPDMVIT